MTDNFYTKIGVKDTFEKDTNEVREKECRPEPRTREEAIEAISKEIENSYLDDEQRLDTYRYVVITDGVDVKKDARLVFMANYASLFTQQHTAYIHKDDARVKDIASRVTTFPVMYDNMYKMILGTFEDLAERGRTVESRGTLYEVKTLEVKKLTESARMPVYSSTGAAALDLHASMYTVIQPGETKLVSTGIAIALPRDTVGRISPRSGLAVRYNIDVRAGVIDEDYRGEIKVVLKNEGEQPFDIFPGDRIAQLLVLPIEVCHPLEVKELEDSNRGELGFGSTGV